MSTAGRQAQPVCWEVHDARAAFPDYASEFDRLSAAMFQAHPLLVSDFVEPLIVHFAGSGDRVCIARTSDDVAAVALLSRRQAGVWSAFVPGQAQVAPVLLPPGTNLDALLAALPGMTIALELLCQDPQFSYVLPEGATTVNEVVTHETTMNISLAGSYDDYWNARPKKLRANIGRYFRRLDRDGLAYRFELLTGRDELLEALGRYGDLESAGWKGRAQSAIHRDNAQGAFYADVLRRFARTGNARIYELYFNDELAASRIAVTSESLLVMLKTTYREALKQYSPGRLMLNLVLRREFAEQDFAAVEFYTDVTRDQLEWATGMRNICHLTHYRNALSKAIVQYSRPLRALIGALRPGR